MKEKFNQMFKDKLFLVMLVLGLLTIVAAAGVVTIQRGNTPGEENPYMEQQQGAIIAEESPEDTLTQIAGNADAQREQPESHINNRAESEPVQVAKEAESTQNKEISLRRLMPVPVWKMQCHWYWIFPTQARWPGRLWAMYCWITAWILPFTSLPWNSTR